MGLGAAKPCFFSARSSGAGKRASSNDCAGSGTGCLEMTCMLCLARNSSAPGSSAPASASDSLEASLSDSAAGAALLAWRLCCGKGVRRDTRLA
jgi:hypothetical protein